MPIHQLSSRIPPLTRFPNVSKKSSRSKGRNKHHEGAASRPEPAQLKAIERLLEERKHAQALERLRSLLDRFPDNGGLYRLLVDALQQEEGLGPAALAARDWVERRPNSLPAHEAFLGLLSQLGLPLLAERSAERIRDMGGQTPGLPLTPEDLKQYLTEPDGASIRRESMERTEIGLLHLQGGDTAGALPLLEKGDTSVARVTSALALFQLGRIEDALLRFDALRDAEPDNLQAAGWAMRLRLYKGDVAGARDMTDVLAKSQARRMEDAVVQIESLLLLQRDSEAMDRFDAAAKDSDRTDPETLGQLRHLGACAAARTGDGARAETLWREAITLDKESILARENLEQIAKEGQAPRFPAVHSERESFPDAWLSQLRGAGANDSAPFRDLDVSNAYLDAVYRGGTHSQRMIVLAALEERVATGDAQAAETFKGFARLDIGDPGERFEMLYLLQDLDMIGPREAVEVWDGEQMREVKLVGTRIVRKPKPHGLPRDQEALFEVALLHHSRGQLLEARTALEGILVLSPDHPVILRNLASILAAEDRADEARQLWQRILDQDADDLFARTSLAVEWIMAGDLERADDLLEGLAERDELHIQEAFSLFGTMAMLHSARGENDAANQMYGHLEALVEDDDDRRWLEEAKLLQRLI